MVDTVVSSAAREVVIGSGRPFVIILLIGEHGCPYSVASSALGETSVRVATARSCQSTPSTM